MNTYDNDEQQCGPFMHFPEKMPQGHQHPSFAPISVGKYQPIYHSRNSQYEKKNTGYDVNKPEFYRFSICHSNASIYVIVRQFSDPQSEPWNNGKIKT
jgi:hypothetical protein